VNRLDFADVPVSHTEAAHALAAAVLANRPILLSGHPGMGKTMLARRATGLLTLDDHARRWLTIEYRALGLMDHREAYREVTEAPFRAPHHTVSAAAMSGTTSTAHHVGCMTMTTPRCICPGNPPRATRGVYTITRPSEVALARFGVLLLDELTEFTRATVEVTAETRRKMAAGKPALIATAMPCPCGWYGAPESALAKACACSNDARERWNARLTALCSTLGIETTVYVPPVGFADLRGSGGRP
jgi:magnesium chelatase family protein